MTEDGVPEHRKNFKIKLKADHGKDEILVTNQVKNTAVSKSICMMGIR